MLFSNYLKITTQKHFVHLGMWREPAPTRRARQEEEAKQSVQPNGTGHVWDQDIYAGLHRK